MIDIIKKSLYAGIGATMVTKQAIESSLEELVEKGKLSSEDAKQTADNICNRGKEEFERSKEELNSFFNDLLAKANLPQQSTVDALEKRIEILETKAGISKVEPE